MSSDCWPADLGGGKGCSVLWLHRMDVSGYEPLHGVGWQAITVSFVTTPLLSQVAGDGGRDLRALRRLMRGDTTGVDELGVRQDDDGLDDLDDEEDWEEYDEDGDLVLSPA